MVACSVPAGPPHLEVNVIARRIYPALPILIAILVTSIPSRAQMSARIAPADILIVHAKVYTLDQHAPWAQALAIRRGKIVAVGSDEVVGRMLGIGTRRRQSCL